MEIIHGVDPSGIARPVPLVPGGGGLRMFLGDDAHFDAFGRLRVSEPAPLFDSMSEYGNNPFLWETAVNGAGAAVTHIANQNAVRLGTGGTANGNYAIRQTRRYCRYQPGRSLNVETTFVMGAARANAVARIGYYDAANGIFLERSGAQIAIVRRTNVTGTPVDNAVAQAAWNKDPLDGSGPSRKTLDLTRANILALQLQYLGVGRVQVGFVIDGAIIVAHEFYNANVLDTVYMSTGCLPVRAEVRNTDVADGALSLDMICTSVSSGGVGAQKLRYHRSNGITAINTSTTLAPILSIRAATLLGGTGGGGSLRNYGHVEPIALSILATGQVHEYQLILNGTLTGASWQPNGAQSVADYDVSASAVAGGTVLGGDYLPASATVRAADSADLFQVLPLVYSGLNNIQDTLTIAARATTGTGTALAGITWDEQF